MIAKTISPLLVALVATATASSAWALPEATGSSVANGTYSVTNGSKISDGSLKEVDSGAYVSVEATKSGSGFLASAEAVGGSLKAIASTSYAPALGWAASTTADATASFTDYVVFTGGAGVSSANLLASLSGSLTGGQIGGRAGYIYNVDLFEVASPLSSETLVSESRTVFGSRTVTLNDTLESGFDFTFGKTYGLTATLTLEARDGGVADFADTAKLNFAVASGVGLVSASGYGYNVAAVPEPQTYAMLLAGLGMIGAIARRRSKL